MPITNCSVEPVSAIVLSGGLARRMGGRKKALVKFSGKPMISYVLEALENQAEALAKILINVNATDGYEHLGYQLIADNLSGNLGPLAGIEAGLAHIEKGYLLVLPCDVPLLNEDVISRLISAVINSTNLCAVAHDGERVQPTFAIFHVSQRDSLEAYLKSGGRRLINWYEEQKIVSVDCADIKQVFNNINTLEELGQAEGLYSKGSS